MAAHSFNLKANSIEDLTDDEGDLGLWAGQQKKYRHVPTLRIACQCHLLIRIIVTVIYDNTDRSPASDCTCLPQSLPIAGHT
jgi:hypothetical protein